MLDNSLKRLTPWLLFGASALVVFVLAQMRAVLVPIAIATLLAFLLTPLVTRLQRRIGRVLAVSLVVVTGTAALGGIATLGWMELGTLADRLPSYRDNIRAKVADIRVLTRGGPVAKVGQVLDDVQKEIGKPTNAPEVVVKPSATDVASSASAIVNPLVAVLVNAGVVFVLVTFMLLERQELRDRVIRLFGHNRLAITTKALDEAGERISRYLYAQLLVNTFYGVMVGAGLHFIGLPHALLWGCFAALLRFVPYVGPWLSAIPPILLSLAVAPGWLTPLAVVGLYIALELFTNMVLETHLYAGVAGISQVGLLVAVLFWSWLWGAAGLLLAAPLTVCLVVAGKYVRQLRFLSELMTEAAFTDEAGRYYQRLLAGDRFEAAEILQRYIRDNPDDNVFDTLMLPALTFAERDVAAGALDAEEEAALHDATAELLDDLAETRGGERTAAKSSKRTPLALVFPVNRKGDALAARMLADLLAGTDVAVEVGAPGALHAEIVQEIKKRGSPVLCLADLPPSGSAKSRYLVYRIRAALPEVRIVVGRWAPPSLVDASDADIVAAGANHVTATLGETRRLLVQMIGLEHAPSPTGAQPAAEDLQIA